MKVIFLDFDGVITTEKSRFNLDKDAVALLGKYYNFDIDALKELEELI